MKYTDKKISHAMDGQPNRLTATAQALNAPTPMHPAWTLPTTVSVGPCNAGAAAISAESLQARLTRRDAEDAMRVVASLIAESNVRIVYHKDDSQGIYADMKTRTLHIPTIAYASGISYATLQIFRGMVYHEAGHLMCSDMVSSQWKGKDLAVVFEEARTMDIDPTNGKMTVPGSKKRNQDVLHFITNAVEDVRMEIEVCKTFPGARSALTALADDGNRKLITAMEKADAEGKRDKMIVSEAMILCIFRGRGMKPLWIPNPKAAEIADIAWQEFQNVFQIKSCDDSLITAVKIYDLVAPKMKEQMDQQQQANGQKGDKGKSGKGKGDKKDGKGGKGDKDEDGKGKGGKNPKTVVLVDGEPGGGKPQDNDDDGMTPKNEGGEGDEDGEGQGGSGPDGDIITATMGEGDEGEEMDADVIIIDMRSIQKQSVVDQQEKMKQQSKQKNVPDPVDVNYTAFRDNDVHKFPNDNSREDYADTTNKIRQTMFATLANLITCLDQDLRAMTRSKTKRFQWSGDVDMRDLAAIAKSTRANVFTSTRAGMELDVAVEIVIDQSGSMSGEGIQNAQATAIALGDALTRIGVQFEITGTSSNCGSAGRSTVDSKSGFTRYCPLTFFHYICFGENWNQVSWRVGTMSSYCNNLDGEAVDYAAFRLKQRREKRKVIFSISDGEPCGGQGNDGEMAGHLTATCKKLRNAGYEVYGFGVNTENPAKYYGKEWFLNIRDPRNLGPEVLKTLSAILVRGQAVSFKGK